MRLADEDDVCEAVQETIVKAYLSLNNLKKTKYFKTWIIKILINECNYLYKSKYRLCFEKYEENTVISGKNDGIDKKISELDFNILLNNLNYNERICITLFYLEELTTKQISKILEESENTIRTRISRARNKLKKIIEEESLYG